MLSSSEHDVAVHITLRDCCDRFVGWLKPAVDMLATCSDVFGEKSAIESKIEKINVHVFCMLCMLVSMLRCCIMVNFIYMCDKTNLQ